MLSAGSQAMKYILFIFNFIFVLTGISLITVGIIIKSNTEKFKPVIDDDFISSSNLLIFLGVFVFIISFFGCCGALRENQCMILTFSVIMAAIFIAEVTIGVTGYMLKAETADVLNKTMYQSMYFYKNDTEFEQFWDAIQGNLNCCGTNNYTDWIKIFPTVPLPITCCATQLGTIGLTECTTTTPSFHKTACLTALSAKVEDYASTLGFTGITIAVIQLLGVIFSCKLAYSIRNSYESV